MLKNYITIAIRNLLKHKAFSLINIAGLSVGVACCLMLVLYIQDELSYDKHHKDGERLYRMTSHLSFDDYRAVPRTSPPIAWGIKDEIPEFETVTRLVNPPGVAQNLIRYGDNQFYESDGYMADSTVFDILTYEFVEGNPGKALTEVNSVVISQNLATKLFGRKSALNKTITINQGGPSTDLKVTGVFLNDKKSHLDINFFVSMNSGGWGEYIRRADVGDEWGGQNFMIAYVKLRPGYVLEDVITKINAAFLKHGAEDLKALGMMKKLGLEPLQDIYLYSTAGNQSARVTYLYIVAAIAVFMLLIACINFMNLSTAKATKRANEVGLRKSLGAYRSALISQFLGETFIIVLVAMLLSCILVQLALPVFNQVTGKLITFSTSNIAFVLFSLSGIAIITGLVAGSYPAFYLSSFQPAAVLKGKAVYASSNSFLRRSLVVFQFVIAIALVCGMIIITKQLKFMEAKHLGFSADHKIVLPLRTQTAQANYTALRNELSKLASVNGITATNYIPGSNIFSDFGLYPQGSSMEKAVLVRNNWVEPNYLDLMDMKLIAGTNFPEVRSAESWRKVILNREAAKQLGFSPEEIVGQPLYFDWQGETYQFEVIGVMENYHQVSLKEVIKPVLFRVNETPNHATMIVDVDGRDIPHTLSSFEDAWKIINSDTPFEYSFLDENIQKQYNEDQKMSLMITLFTIIAMIISCLGLYGLSTYMAERRFKEIGVRKVMGASVNQIVGLMSKEFLKLVIIAFVIAVPLAWYTMNKWLEGFAYKMTIDALIFLYAGVGALAIALLTVSFESLKAASANPVKSLRSE